MCQDRLFLFDIYYTRPYNYFIFYSGKKGYVMKHYFKKILPLVCMLICLCCTPVSAASLPGKVTGLKATSSDTTIKLRWNKASRAKKYAIYRVDRNGGQEKLIKKTSGRTYSAKGSSGTTYYFKVCALNSAGKSGTFSPVVAVTPRAKAPNTPQNFSLKSRGDKYVTLRWSGVGNADGYVIEQYNTSKSSYETVKTITSRKTKEARVSNLTPNVTYKFRIRSYRNINGQKIYSNPSSVVSVQAVKLSSAVQSIRSAYYKTKVKQTVTASNLSSGGNITLKKGSTLLATGKSGSYVTGYTSSGVTVKVRRSYLRYTGLDSRSDYSTNTKELYINSKGYSSRTGSFIWVSQHTYRVNIFKGSAGKWKLVKSFPCIVGKWNTRTPNGLHRILSNSGHGYGSHYIYFTAGSGTSSNPSGNAFHHYVDGNRTGAKSHGCVRLSTAALNYIYSNCRVGTTVLVY